MLPRLSKQIQDTTGVIRIIEKNYQTTYDAAAASLKYLKIPIIFGAMGGEYVFQ
jgi:hypothetical protein